jgi:hypothetical protein
MKRSFWPVLTQVFCEFASNARHSNLNKIVSISDGASGGGGIGRRGMVSAAVIIKSPAPQDC